MWNAILWLNNCIRGWNRRYIRKVIKRDWLTYFAILKNHTKSQIEIIKSASAENVNALFLVE